MIGSSGIGVRGTSLLCAVVYWEGGPLVVMCGGGLREAPRCYVQWWIEGGDPPSVCAVADCGGAPLCFVRWWILGGRTRVRLCVCGFRGVSPLCCVCWGFTGGYSLFFRRETQ